MKVLIIGGANTVTNALIQKFDKEGHCVYVLTGGRQQHNNYKKVYEQYHFSYENSCIKEVFESIHPELTIFMGAFDSNYNWNNCYEEANRYSLGLQNVITAFLAIHNGRFVYLSSDTVFDVTEDEYNHITAETRRQLTDSGIQHYSYAYKANAVKNGENICNYYRQITGFDIITVRINEMCCLAKNFFDATDVFSKLCIEALKYNTLTFTKDTYSPLYISDAVEFLYRLTVKKNLSFSFYEIQSDNTITAKEAGKCIDLILGITTEKKMQADDETIWIETSALHNIHDELTCNVFYNAESCIRLIARHIKKNKNKFEALPQNSEKKSVRLKQWFRNVGLALLPFIENFICFIPFFMINNRVTDSAYFARLDCYLLYVLLFAIIYGQQQAMFSSILSVCGYFFRQMYHRSGFEIALDYNTYVWIAQIIIVGLSVGYLRDALRSAKDDRSDEIYYLTSRLKDIEDINRINAKLKEELEIQIINQSDSIGTIFEITSTLDSDEPESVFFHAAEVVAQLMDCRDVAIYNVSNRNYARLMSSTSANARKLGNSIEYTGYTQMYAMLQSGSVYINKKLDPDYPIMAAAITSDDKIQSIIMLWNIAWERMNLSQSNRLKVIAYLIQNALLRANRYIQVLEQERYIENTKILEPAAFRSLIKAFLAAQKKALADCSLIKITPDKEGIIHTSEKLSRLFRTSDYIGSLDDGYLYVLLANTNLSDAGYVTERISEAGYTYDIVKEI